MSEGWLVEKFYEYCEQGYSPGIQEMWKNLKKNENTHLDIIKMVNIFIKKRNTNLLQWLIRVIPKSHIYYEYIHDIINLYSEDEYNSHQKSDLIYALFKEYKIDRLSAIFDHDDILCTALKSDNFKLLRLLKKLKDENRITITIIPAILSKSFKIELNSSLGSAKLMKYFFYFDFGPEQQFGSLSNLCCSYQKHQTDTCFYDCSFDWFWEIFDNNEVAINHLWKNDYFRKCLASLFFAMKKMFKISLGSDTGLLLAKTILYQFPFCRIKTNVRLRDFNGKIRKIGIDKCINPRCSRGLIGLDGVPGPRGQDGVPGPRGFDGVPGPRGFDGAPGP